MARNCQPIAAIQHGRSSCFVTLVTVVSLVAVARLASCGAPAPEAANQDHRATTW